MATNKKQVSSVSKPRDKNAVIEAKNERATATSEKKTIVNELKKTEEKPRLFASRRVWPD